MKKLVLFIVVFILLGLWGFGVILPDAGYVLVVLGQKTVETSLWFTCFAILAIGFVWWLVARFVRAGWSLAQRLTDFFVFGTSERASRRAASGLIDFLAGDWLQARKKLLRTATKVESPLVNYLTAARCSYELGDRDEAVRLLADAQKRYPHFYVAIGLVQVKMELSGGRQDQAKHILLALQQRAPKNGVVINHLRQMYEARGEWLALSEILPVAKKYKLCSVNDTLEMEASVMVGELQRMNKAAAHESPAERLVLLRKAWAKIPAYQQRNPRIVYAYVQSLLEHLQDQEAEVMLRKTINIKWDDRLVNLYGLLRVNGLMQCIRNAEDWLKLEPHNPVLLRSLGRLSLRNEAWNSARDYFQRSLAAQKNPETYAELARLLNNLGETQKSLETYQAALLWNAESLPDLPQPAKAY
ncbi:MAG: heme biosynthesis HemY N-terminal domain-containing protein [Pseudomonadota bacterium]